MRTTAIILLSFSLFALLFVVLPAPNVRAATAYASTTLESGIPGNAATVKGQPIPSNPAQYIKYLYLFVMGFIGIAGFVTLVIWGTVWTASGVIDKKAAAMEGIKNTLMGIGIALTAYLLLSTINPDLTIISFPNLEKTGLTDLEQKKVDFASLPEYQWGCEAYGMPTGYSNGVATTFCSNTGSVAGPEPSSPCPVGAPFVCWRKAINIVPPRNYAWGCYGYLPENTIRGDGLCAGTKPDATPECSRWVCFNTSL